MKTKKRDDISIIIRKAKAPADRAVQMAEPQAESKTVPAAEPKSAPAPSIAEKPRLSLASKLTSSYNRLFITWMSIALVVVVFSMVVFNIIIMINADKPSVDRIKALPDRAAIVAQVQQTRDVSLVLADEANTLLAASDNRTSVRTGKFPVGFERNGQRIFLSITTKIDLPDGQRLLLLCYHDITLFLSELVVVGLAGILVYIVAMAFLFFRGNTITRKTFSVMDEMVVKANNISSQNLNLRLNVSDSSDELKDFALTFNKMMDRLERSYEKQNQFVSDASHELRTPISVIQGYARMLDRWGKDDKEILSESIEAINKESKNMQDLVDKLLFIARNDRDSLVLVKEKFNLSDLVEELARETKMLETGHDIRCFAEPNISLFGDRNRIKQALRIFADNALKYTPSEGAVTFRLDVSEGQALIVVKDTGMGIPEKALPNIFDRFYRVDAARARHQGGHGLGLSIARIIILRHGGRIKVASKEQEGTRFSIYLPFEMQAEPTEPDAELVRNSPT